MLAKATISVKGDYGNPSGTGLSELVLAGMVVEDYTSMQTKAAAFHAALKAAQLTATNIGEINTQQKSESGALKPEADVNVDRKLVYTWRTKTSAQVHRQTVVGVPAVSTGITKEAAGERLNEVGKAAIAAAWESALGLVAGDIIVLQGKVLQPA